MVVQPSQPPFTHQLLGSDVVQGNEASQWAQEDLASLLPASRRTTENDVVAPTLSPNPAANGANGIDDGIDIGRLTDVYDWIDEEFNLRRLSTIQDWLWIVGRPMPPRPLHHQRLLNREIVITERLDQHLVWTTGHVFIKPLPRFLLSPRFWEKFLCCHRVLVTSLDSCSCGGRRERALGFLMSYAALIQHESDFQIAKEKYLIPQEVQWLAWRAAVQQFARTSPIYPWVDRRFYYGELRLSRLNKIYFFWQEPFHTYMSPWDQYGSFFHDNFAWLASSTVYIAVVLTAMQVGLATESLQSNQVFQSASYDFTVFSILGPLAAVTLVVLVFLFMFIGNWITTVQYSRKRLAEIDMR